MRDGTHTKHIVNLKTELYECKNLLLVKNVHVSALPNLSFSIARKFSIAVLFHPCKCASFCFLS
jgi:hypothetical protein